MQRVLAAVALATAAGANASAVSFESAHQQCTFVGNLASSVASMRDSGIPMVKVVDSLMKIDGIREDSEEVALPVVRGAYAMPESRSPREAGDQARKYADKVYMDCIDATMKD